MCTIAGDDPIPSTADINTTFTADNILRNHDLDVVDGKPELKTGAIFKKDVKSPSSPKKMGKFVGFLTSPNRLLNGGGSGEKDKSSRGTVGKATSASSSSKTRCDLPHTTTAVGHIDNVSTSTDSSDQADKVISKRSKSPARTLKSLLPSSPFKRNTKATSSALVVPGNASHYGEQLFIVVCENVSKAVDVV